MTMYAAMVTSLRILTLLAMTLLSASAQVAPDAASYTLYRNSAVDAAMRLHVASFDAVDGAAYNRENCAQAQLLFAAQPGVKAKFWCEAGKFHALPAGDRAPSPGPQFTTGASTAPTCSPSASKLARGEKPPASAGDTCPP